MVVKSKAPGDSKFYDNLVQAAIQLTSIISKESRNAPTCFRAKKTRGKQQPDGLQGHHFQVPFNLKIILSMVKITQNIMTVLLLCAVSFNTSNAHSIIELYWPAAAQTILWTCYIYSIAWFLFHECSFNSCGLCLTALLSSYDFWKKSQDSSEHLTG